MVEKQATLERVPIEEAEGVQLDGAAIEQLYDNMHIAMDPEKEKIAKEWAAADRAVKKVIPDVEGSYQIGELGEVKVKQVNRSAAKARPKGTAFKKSLQPLSD